MRLLHPTGGGQHFAQTFTASAAPINLGPADFCKSLGPGTSRLLEGSKPFKEYQACILRDADRSVYAASSLFLRALGLFTRSSSPWLHVTLYYSSFLAAKAAASTLGAWDDGRWQVICQIEKPGKQDFLAKRTNRQMKGSHRGFWHEFYRSVTALKSWASAGRAVALDPVNGDPEWLIQQRNRYNYEMSQWWHHMNSFGASFAVNRFPSSLPKELGQQFEVAKEMLGFAYDVAVAVGLRTDVFGPNKDRITAIRTEIFNCTLADLEVYEKSVETELLGSPP